MEVSRGLWAILPSRRLREDGRVSRPTAWEGCSNVRLIQRNGQAPPRSTSALEAEHTSRGAEGPKKDVANMPSSSKLSTTSNCLSMRVFNALNVVQSWPSKGQRIKGVETLQRSLHHPDPVSSLYVRNQVGVHHVESAHRTEVKGASTHGH